MIVRPTTAGAQKLADYLERQKQTLHAFCDAHGIDYAQAHRNLSGLRGKRISVDFATAIERATGGEVAVESWCQGTLSSSDTPAATGTEG